MSNLLAPTRRGFLSLCLGISIPKGAQCSKETLIVNGFDENFELVSYMLSLKPMHNNPVKPGEVIILSGKSDIVLRPNRLLLTTGGFNLLHLGTDGSPMLVNEVPSEFFMPNSYGNRLSFATVNPGDEIVIAAINRSNEAAILYGSIIATARVAVTPEERERRRERAKYFRYIDCSVYDESNDIECENSIEYDTRLSELPEGWTIVNEGDNIIHELDLEYYCPQHSNLLNAKKL